ncbi:MAG: UDP-3-O-(3-hydroxymyristoyl)glucosamine N-acyltransferase [Gemmatimonadota bacterium]|nr:UDP-3-O-(3-hydroxymyristoyl)glucosamine N-acyltransferase [Gemmatimonadales bacterium]MDQ3136543.1 UDP-3-O-(3-hydroxymyristoyl)glucosamine N-acyltransferase [Gemmatimonadota bacterium]
MTSAGLTAQAVADLVGGRLLGDGTVLVRTVRALDSAGPDAVSLAVSDRYAAELRASRAGAVLVPEALAEAPEQGRARIVVPDPYAALVRVIGALFPDTGAPPGIDATVRVGMGCVLGDGVSIGPFAVLGPGVHLGHRCRIAAGVSLGDAVTVGEDTVIGPHAVCYPGVRIGSRVVIKAGAVLGGPGFGYLPGGAGHTRIPHIGGCILEDEVEIGSNSCVDRGSVADTIVGAGTKLDNLVHIGHNVRIGKRCLLMAGVGVAGSTRIGDDVILAGHVGVTDHLVIGDRARIAAKSAVFGDIPAGASFSGHPARPHRQFLRAQAALYRVAPIISELERLVPTEGRDA